MAVALACVCIVLGIVNPDFWMSANVLNTLRHIAMLGIYTVGLAFVIIIGGIDLSVGSMIGLSGVTVAALTTSGTPIWQAVVIAILISIAVGFGQGLLITRLRLQSFIVTLGTMLLLRGISQTICKGGTISLGYSPLRDLADGGIIHFGHSYLLSYPVLIFIVVALAGAYLLHYTVFGRYLYAIGGNRDAAIYSGVAVTRVELTAYVISAGLAGLAGIVYAAYIGQMSHTVGSTYELIGIAAAVLGGCSLRGGEGSVLGIVVGSALMKVIENSINMFKISYHDAAGIAHEWRLNTNWQYIVIGVVILLAVILDQAGHLLRARWQKIVPRRTELASSGRQ